MKVGQSPSLIRNSDARVVLPAPLGPAIIRMLFSESVYLSEGIGCRTGLVGEPFTPHPSPLLEGFKRVRISRIVTPACAGIQRLGVLRQAQDERFAGATYGAGQALFTLTPNPPPSRERGALE